MFGLNAGRQCITMSLSALIYNHRSSISSSAHLVNIMNIGKELFFVKIVQERLFTIDRDFLILTDLPSMVTVLKTNYQMEYSPSYIGNIHDVSFTVDFLYCMPLGNALQILIGDNYQSVILTIQCSTVAIYCHGDQRFGTFDSRAGDSSGLPYPNGIYVLLGFYDFNALINYFQDKMFQRFHFYLITKATFAFFNLEFWEICTTLKSLAHGASWTSF